MKEAFPLAWPQGWPRTRPQDQKENHQWKLDLLKCQELLTRELERMGVVSMLLSTNIPVGLRGQLVTGTSVRDPGVAVYFTMKSKDDFSWQEVLKISNPYPTIEEIEAAYRPLAIRWHPDAQGGDGHTFQMISEARAKAKRWLEQHEKHEHQHVIACDKWKEVRWNINAIRLALSSIRAVDRYGVTGILERVFKGFEELPEYASSGTTASTRA